MKNYEKLKPKEKEEVDKLASTIDSLSFGELSSIKVNTSKSVEQQIIQNRTFEVKGHFLAECLEVLPKVMKLFEDKYEKLNKDDFKLP